MKRWTTVWEKHPCPRVPSRAAGETAWNIATASVLLASQEPWAGLQGPSGISVSHVRDRGSVLATWTGGAAKSDKSATSVCDGLVTCLGILCFSLSVFFSCTSLVILCLIMPPADLMPAQGKLGMTATRGKMVRGKRVKREARMSLSWCHTCCTNVCHIRNDSRLIPNHRHTDCVLSPGMPGPLHQASCL